MTTSIKQHFLMLLAGNAAFAFLPVSTTYAQEANNTVRLDTVVVQTGNGRSDEGVAPVNSFVPTATTTGSKDNVAIEKIPQSVSVVGRKQMDAIGAQKLDEALRYTPGVLGQPFGVSITIPTGSIFAVSKPPNTAPISTACRTSATASVVS